MKKKLMVLAGSLMALAMCATTYFATNSTSEVSLLMQNVEAMARNENPMCPNGCYWGNDECYCYIPVVGIEASW